MIQKKLGIVLFCEKISWFSLRTFRMNKFSIFLCIVFTKFNDYMKIINFKLTDQVKHLQLIGGWNRICILNFSWVSNSLISETLLLLLFSIKYVNIEINREQTFCCSKLKSQQNGFECVFVFSSCKHTYTKEIFRNWLVLFVY